MEPQDLQNEIIKYLLGRVLVLEKDHKQCPCVVKKQNDATLEEKRKKCGEIKPYCPHDFDISRLVPICKLCGYTTPLITTCK